MIVLILLFLQVAIPIGVSKSTSNKTNISEVVNTIDETVTFSTPQLQVTDDCTKISLNEETSKFIRPNKPILPVVTKVFQLPFKSKIIDVDVIFSEENKITLSKKIQLTTSFDENVVYEQKTIPQNQFSYNIAAGIDNENLVNFLSIRLYPIKYSESECAIYYFETANIKIRYEPPTDPFILSDEYDMIIISPWLFSFSLRPLVTHKNSHGINTKIVTTNEIYESRYFTCEGRDDAEKIKYFIKNAFDEWGIKYVLLVGGRKGGILESTWWMPVRYSNCLMNNEWTYLTDLYFADIYNSDGSFSSWDTNNNEIYAEWHALGKDELDMYPDVYIGRLPCKSIKDVEILVNKIIDYENNAKSGNWFDRYVGVGGDSWPEYNDYFEGEMATEAAYSYLEGIQDFQKTYLWTSEETFSCKEDIIEEADKGCGILYLSGHGTPNFWGTHPPHVGKWISGPMAIEMHEFNNIENLPIVLVGGCHNSQFDTSLFNIIKGIIEEGFLKYFRKSSFGPTGFWKIEWIPRCWSESMIVQENGGCIAVMGNSGAGNSIPGEYCLNVTGRFFELQFFKAYSEGKDILGETYANQLIHYMNVFSPMIEEVDCKTVQQWILFGDPSLKIGGY
jgi:hypothetical protein